ncbi:MAG TPA: M1 family aminopeptidase [Vicinamibacterales bacterium]|nr:M1 family aminopeptidase [Vicinamibacterales bacterium]
MTFAILIAFALLWLPPPQATAQPDPIAGLVQQMERAAGAGNREALRALGVDMTSAAELAAALTSPAPSRIVIRERDRTAIPGGQRLLLEIFWERATEGRLGTWSVDVAPVEEGWRIASAASLASVSGLYRLALNTAKQFDVRNLSVQAPDLTLTLPVGSAFVAETPDGVTAVVLVGRGTMRFAPPEAAERTQVKIFSGDEVLSTSFDAAFVRVRPEDFSERFPSAALLARAPDARDADRAREIFEEYVGRTLQINLTDLSPDRWSITPQAGDFIAEVRTDDFGALTYSRARGDAEDVTVFDRKKRRNISVYASAEKLATRGRFYNEDDLVDYDILEYQLDATILPEREIVQGTARLKLKVRAAAVATINLRLAEQLAVAGVSSPDFGRLLHLRVVNQNSLLVSMPGSIPNGTEFWLVIQYGGRIPPQELEREAITVAQEGVRDPVVLPPEPRFIYSNRSYWYPQSIVSDYAPVKLKITVPAEYEVIATGLPVGEPAPPPGVVEGPRRRMFLFESERPVRYLACVISRLRDVESHEVMGIDGADGSLMLHVLSNPRQVGRARALGDRGAAIFAYYGKLIGDTPYPSFTLGVTERELPGGHSPAYFAVVDQPQQSTVSWRNDPVNFDNYPSFFVAHEIAHQWWGQGVGWKNYHEQWLSEGLAQYFATLYAGSDRGPEIVTTLLTQMRESAEPMMAQGPIFLGYRLGHVQSEGRVFRAIVYNKSAVVLHMLRRLMGDEAFFKGIQAFYRDWRFSKAGTDDFRAIMETQTPLRLTRFFERWILGSTIPRARVTPKIDADGKTAVVRIEQVGDVFDFPLTVVVQYGDNTSEEITVAVTEATVDHKISLKSPARRIFARDPLTFVEIVR